MIRQGPVKSKTRVCSSMKTQSSMDPSEDKRKILVIPNVCEEDDLRWWAYGGVVGSGIAPMSQVSKKNIQK